MSIPNQVIYAVWGSDDLMPAWGVHVCPDSSVDEFISTTSSTYTGDRVIYCVNDPTSNEYSMVVSPDTWLPADDTSASNTCVFALKSGIYDAKSTLYTDHRDIVTHVRLEQFSGRLLRDECWHKGDTSNNNIDEKGYCTDCQVGETIAFYDRDYKSDLPSAVSELSTYFDELTSDKVTLTSDANLYVVFRKSPVVCPMLKATRVAGLALADRTKISAYEDFPTDPVVADDAHPPHTL